MCGRGMTFCAHANTNAGRDGESERARRCSCTCEAERLEVSSRHQRGHFIFTQNHQLHPTSTVILVCCFSAAAGEGRWPFVVLQPERWEGFSTAYVTRLFFIKARGCVYCSRWVSIRWWVLGFQYFRLFCFFVFFLTDVAPDLTKLESKVKRLWSLIFIPQIRSSFVCELGTIPIGLTIFECFCNDNITAAPYCSLSVRVSDGVGQAWKETPRLHLRINGGADNNSVSSERAQSGTASIFSAK